MLSVEEERPSRRSRAAPALAAVGLLALSAAVSRQSGAREDSGPSSAASSLAARDGGDAEPAAESPAQATLSLRLRSEGYVPLSAAVAWYPWDYIVEPHKSTTLAVEGCDASADATYSWTVVHHSPEHPELPTSVVQLDTESGCEVKAKFTAASQMHKATVSLTRGDGATSEHTFELMCKYVRREIRDLTVADRTAYFRAMSTVAKLDLATGIARYGSKFVNLEYFAVKHIHTQECSPFHGGLSFLTAHAAFTLELEQSLQAIDPSVAQPYWDYTKDEKLYGSDWGYESPLFQPDWFGNIQSNESVDYIIADGWFAHTPVPTNRSRPVHNSYGRITTSINNDPSQYVTRAHEFCGIPVDMPLPGCKEMTGCLTTDNLVDLHYCLEDELHGDLHAILGGAWDCGVSIERITAISNETLYQQQLGRIGCKARARCVFTCLSNGGAEGSVTSAHVVARGSVKSAHVARRRNMR